jgi:sn-glycerol 3-phosphate transport system substrate-binding protein
MRKFSVLMVVVLAFILTFSAAAQEPVTIEFWHAMGGYNGEIVNTIVDRFNESHDDIQVEAQNTGSYNDTLTKTQAAVQSGSAPHIVQIYEIGTQVMLDSGIIIPVEELGREVAQDDSFDWGKFLIPVSNYYNVNGQLNSMPFNSSTPILYYNKDAFEEAGLDPNQPPQTFEELKEYARKLTIRNEDGDVERYGFTLGIVGWFVEQMTANQDALLVNNNNGRGEGRATESYLDQEPVVRFIELWQEMVDEGIMLNPGRGWDGAKQAFLSGRAAMMIESTAQVTNFTNNAENDGYELGTAFLPRPEGVDRGGVIIGGASLWAVRDHPEEELKAAWEFLSFLSEMEQHLQLLLSKRAPSTQGALIGTFPEVRQIVEEAVEKTLQGDMTPQEAMDEAASRVDRSLEQYNSLFE